jgi:hypothetical protein
MSAAHPDVVAVLGAPDAAVALARLVLADAPRCVRSVDTGDVGAARWKPCGDIATWCACEGGSLCEAHRGRTTLRPPKIGLILAALAILARAGEVRTR